MNRYFIPTIKQPKHYLLVLCMLLSSIAFNQAYATVTSVTVNVKTQPSLGGDVIIYYNLATTNSSGALSNEEKAMTVNGTNCTLVTSDGSFNCSLPVTTTSTIPSFVILFATANPLYRFAGFTGSTEYRSSCGATCEYALNGAEGDVVIRATARFNSTLLIDPFRCDRMNLGKPCISSTNPSLSNNLGLSNSIGLGH